MRVSMRLIPIIVIATLGLGFSGCQLSDERTDGTDLILKNGGTVALQSVTVNGVEQGPLPPGALLTLEDVGEGSLYVQAFRDASDERPCATWRSPGLRKGETVHHAFDCP